VGFSGTKGPFSVALSWFKAVLDTNKYA
jgi:hypothetical protein